MLVHNLPFYSVVFASPKMLFVEITICRATEIGLLRRLDLLHISHELADSAGFLKK